MDPGACGPKQIATKLHVNWAHSSAHQVIRVLVDFHREIQRLLDCAEEVLCQSEVCRALKKAPHLPAAGTSAASFSNGELQMDLLFLGAAVALHAMDM